MTPFGSAFALAPFVLLALLSSGCRSTAPGIDTESTRVMLDRIAEEVGPKVPFVGEAKVVELLEGSRNDRSSGSFGRRLRLASAYLRTGRAADAIALYDELLAEAVRNGMAEPERIETVEFPRAVAFLRLGEQQNCVGHHSADSCLFPIKGRGIHQEKRGSEAAVRAFQAILEKRPDDLLSKWLLGIANMTLGRTPEDLPPAMRLDPTAWKPKVPFPTFRNVAIPLDMAHNGLAGGVVVEDFDGDGYLDVMTSSSFPLDDWSGQLRLFRNSRDGSFEDVTEAAGLLGIHGGLNLVQADVDNNGFPDVLVLRGAWQLDQGNWPATLLRNDGGKFTDATVKAGLLAFEPTQAATFGDFDGDGAIDLFVGVEAGIPQRKNVFGKVGSGLIRGIYDLFHEKPRPHLYRNRGDGTFVDVLPTMGLDLSGWIKGADAADYDRDGRMDIYLSRYGDSNVLLHNDGVGKDGRLRFSDRTGSAGVGEPILSFSTWFFDYDNDGWDDLFVGGYPYAEVRLSGSGLPIEFRMSNRNEIADFLGLPIDSGDGLPRLFRNRGNGTFENVTEKAGLSHVMAVMGANFGDLDGDGFLDLYIGTGTPPFYFLVPNRAWWNRGGKTFDDVTVAANLGTLAKGHAIGFGDLDNDGDQDIYESLGGAFPADVYPNALFENPGHGNDWITLRLEGDPALGSNRSAIGARIEVEIGEGPGVRRIVRTVGSGGSFGASCLRAEIGLGRLGEREMVSAVTITWPDRTRSVQRLGPLAKNSFYSVRQGKPAEPSPLGKLRFATGDQAAPSASDASDALDASDATKVSEP